MLLLIKKKIAPGDWRAIGIIEFNRYGSLPFKYRLKSTIFQIVNFSVWVIEDIRVVVLVESITKLYVIKINQSLKNTN